MTEPAPQPDPAAPQDSPASAGQEYPASPAPSPATQNPQPVEPDPSLSSPASEPDALTPEEPGGHPAGPSPAEPRDPGAPPESAAPASGTANAATPDGTAPASAASVHPSVMVRLADVLAHVENFFARHPGLDQALATDLKSGIATAERLNEPPQP